MNSENTTDRSGPSTTVHTRPDCAHLSDVHCGKLETFDVGEIIPKQYNNSGIVIGPRWCTWCESRTHTESEDTFEGVVYE